MKSGITSFPLEVDLNDKFKLLEAEYGSKGFAVLIKLFQHIYSKGYYATWNIDVGCLFMRERCPDMGWQFVSEVVSCAVKRGIFDKPLYEKYGILTSETIQETYFFATQRRKTVEVEKNYLLPIAYKFIGNVNISYKNVSKNAENVNIFEQRKGKERKGKESIVVAQNQGETLTGDDYESNPLLSESEYNMVCNTIGKEACDLYVLRVKAFKKAHPDARFDVPSIILKWHNADNKRAEEQAGKVEKTYTSAQLNAITDGLKYEDL